MGLLLTVRGMFLLGPLKTRLHREMGTSNSQFSLLIASFKWVFGILLDHTAS